MAVGLALLPIPHERCLIVEVFDQHTHRTYVSSTVEPGTVIELRWIHSIEHTPWRELYRVSEERTLVLTDVFVTSYGAGVPSDLGTTTLEDGWIHMSGINRPIEHLRWVHSHLTHHELRIGTRVIATDDLPHHAFIELRCR